MKINFLKHFHVALFSILLFSTQIYSQENDEAMMREYMRLAQPGPAHEMLKKFEGKWDITYYWYTDPNKEPIVTTASGETKMILGDRFLELTSIGEAMGQVIESMTIMGHDNRTGKHTLYSFDTMGTYALNAEGDYDEEQKLITYNGTNFEPAMGRDVDYKIIWYLGNEDEYNVDILFELEEGTYTKVMELRGNRI